MRRKKAVALAYDPRLPAPYVAASGRGGTAERMVEIAREAGVPVREHEFLAEALVPLEVGAFVPEPYWELVAGIFAGIAEIEARARRGTL